MGTKSSAMKVPLLACVLVIGLTKADLVLLGRSAQCDGTVCPGGCCPEPGWFCCPNSLYCASVPANCPPGEVSELVVDIAKKRQCEGTVCPGGCCPEVNWYAVQMGSTVHQAKKTVL